MNPKIKDALVVLGWIVVFAVLGLILAGLVLAL